MASPPLKADTSLPRVYSPFDPLPTELLSLIVEQLPARCRLLVLTQVCKRWHAAVIRSIKELKTRGEHQRHLARFPSLTKVTLSHFNHPVELPTSVTRLSLKPLSGYTLAVTACSPLTHLEIVSIATGVGLLRTLLQSSRASLEHLRIRSGILMPEQLDAPHLPALTSLHFEGLLLMADLVVAHASQLTSLTLFGNYNHHQAPIDKAMRVAYPRLRHLNVNIVDLTAEALEQLLSQAPALVTLKLASTRSFVTLQPRLLSTLVEIWEPAAETSDKHGEFLDSLPRLRSFWPASSPLLIVGKPSPTLCTRVASLMLSSEWESRVMSAALARFSNVQRLALNKPPDVTPHLYLPCLTSLRVGGENVAAFRALLPACPALRKVHTDARSSPSAVADWVLALERHGVAKVVVGPFVSEEQVRALLPDRILWIAIKFRWHK